MIDKVVDTIQGSVKIMLLALLLLSSQAWSATEKRKLIIDADPGVDDALALILAMQYPDFEILGVTTTFGDVDLEQTTHNALRIVELSGQSIPVYQGAGKPLVVVPEAKPTLLNGKDGLGNVEHAELREQAQHISAAQFMVEMATAYPGQISIVALGRLTNLAQALKQDPKFAKNIQQVVIMGGSLFTPGNVSPVAEANIAGDPHAADTVFTAPWKVTMVGLDVTTKLRINDKMLTRIKARNQRFGEFVYAITRFYADHHRQQQLDGGFYVKDATALVYLIEPGLFELKRGAVRVVTDGLAIGQTIMAGDEHQFSLLPWKDKPFVSATISVDKTRVEQTLETLLLGEWPPVAKTQRSKTK